MKRKNNKTRTGIADLFTPPLPGPLFKARYMPPTKRPVDAGDWKETPLFKAATEAENSKLQPSLFNDSERE